MSTEFKKKTLAIVGTVGLPANYGGWETLVENIISPLTNEYNVTVFCSSKRYKKKPTEYLDAKLEYINLDANGVQSIFYDIASLWKARKFDNVLILGTSGCIALPIFRAITNCKYFLNIDGLEWKRQKWSFVAKSYLRLSEYFGCKSSHELISDNAVIRDYILDTYSRRSHLIAYGGDRPDTAENGDVEVSQEERKPYFFSVCRIEPENNTHLILEAFKVHDDADLIFVGNWDSSNYGRSMRELYGSEKNITLLDPIYDRDALDFYRENCIAYLHGHSAGGTNPSLVEAMSLGLPIFSFDVNFNRETTENEALYFKDVPELIELVVRAELATLVPLRSRMKEIADRRYTWGSVSGLYVELLK
jgi:glycosyltransferase involved in cell wall biosynthesis